ncbi:SRPBCC domain-containing protein [Nemorincola caseinilytica]|uniref:SRPBCC domain-containing protein n=1 Tax=Nemorincola caseinilytica TaxID=2054315 RepID=A0ABP8NJD3_9BACT
MEKKQYKVQIDAPREKVWDILWDDKTYREWTTAFSPGSYAVTDWKTGSKTLFLGENGDGMVSRIAESRPAEFMSIEHLGEVRGRVEDTTSEKVRQWAGSLENYTLRNSNGGTELVVDIDVPSDFVEMFDGMWPKAMANIKAIAER